MEKLFNFLVVEIFISIIPLGLLTSLWILMTFFVWVEQGIFSSSALMRARIHFRP
jgi:hypothetical protein